MLPPALHSQGLFDRELFGGCADIIKVRGGLVGGGLGWECDASQGLRVWAAACVVGPLPLAPFWA